MREKKFTDGEWAAKKNSCFWEINIVDEYGWVSGIGDVCATAPCNQDTGEAEANAVLIAAAPELLEALELLAHTGVFVDRDGCPSKEQLQIEAAIAKAYGE